MRQRAVCSLGRFSTTVAHPTLPSGLVVETCGLAASYRLRSRLIRRFRWGIVPQLHKSRDHRALEIDSSFQNSRRYWLPSRRNGSVRTGQCPEAAAFLSAGNIRRRIMGNRISGSNPSFERLRQLSRGRVYQYALQGQDP
jgi:hypothetical protein